MSEPGRLLDVVALTVDLPAQHLVRGQVESVEIDQEEFQALLRRLAGR